MHIIGEIFLSMLLAPAMYQIFLRHAIFRDASNDLKTTMYREIREDPSKDITQMLSQLIYDSKDMRSSCAQNPRKFLS